MDIPLNAQVEYTDGVTWHTAGRCVCLLINPITDQVTHLVVEEESFPNTQLIVPVDLVAETTVDTIRLRCNKDELAKMNPFIKTTFVEKELPITAMSYGGGYGMGMNPSFYWPYASFDGTIQVPVEHLQVPPGELVVRRGTRVEATDGYVGKVDEFVVNPENGHITHLVMREGHLWGKKDVIIPLSAMGDTHDDTVFLKLDKQQIESLPTYPLQRHWS
jgi:sporulation protein YlmC with PRC-barrel domain